mgnify:CR=1 FL=1
MASASAERWSATVTRTPRALTFGVSPDAVVRAVDLALEATGSRFRVDGVAFTLPVPGRHNIENALAALAVVNSQRPTAELRPPGEGQTDEGDLMPYRVLDAIERARQALQALAQHLAALAKGGLGHAFQHAGG